MKRPTYWLFLSLLVISGGSAAAGPRPAATTLDLPIKEVTVFSDRARVQRAGQFRLDKGEQTLTLPRLPATADPDSVRVEATGAKIARVEVKRATLEEFPRTEAEKVLHVLETLRDEERALRDELATLEQERQLLRNLRPTATPKVDDRSAPLLLESGGWRASLQFIDAREAALAVAMPPVEAKLAKKEQEIAAARARAEQIAASAAGQEELKVFAVVEGEGKTAELTMTYMASNAVWHPVYDVRFAPGDSAVDVGFAALVQQQTGEDWNDARLTLSTAVPLNTATLPQLAVWKIGERERFIPTPVAAPVPAPPPVEYGEASGEEYPGLADSRQVSDEDLRSQLLMALNGQEPGKDLEQGLGGLGARGAGAGRGAAAKAPMKKSFKAAAPQNFADDQMQAEAPPPPPAPVAAMPAPAAAPRVQAESMALEGQLAESRVSRGPASESIAFSAPRGWQQPYFAGDLPASLAGGYTFTYPSARAETIHGNGEVRRISLFTKKLPATPFLKILPALSKQAYLVTEISNAAERPLLGGQAHLFVGADMVGDANIPTTAVGQKITLPLGVDDGIRIERNVNVVESQRGVFSKQDVNAYEVTIELMNPRNKTVKARVLDQLPLPPDKELEVTLDKSSPTATRDETDGVLSWEVELPPGAKKTVSFTYSVARPKDSKLWQYTQPAGDH